MPEDKWELCGQREMRCLEKSGIIPESSIVKRFDPILDEFGHLRIGGRLSNAKLDYDEMHPVILPTKHLLTQVIVREHPVRNGHLSPEKLLHSLRSKYWLITGRPVLKSVVNKCVSCKKRNAQPMSTIMAPLPEHRVTPFRPAFAFTGLDFFGSLYVSLGARGKSTEKRWISACLHALTPVLFTWRSPIA